MGYTLKQVVGSLLLDVPRFEWLLRASWLHIRNRDERLVSSEDGRGVACDWRWTSDLYAPKLFPSLGTRLAARCLRDWPFEFAPAPREAGGEPKVSFIIGHRGRERLPLLLATLETLAAQEGVACECIVVEQSGRSDIASDLPSWVRYVHTPLPHPDLPYCRSWALNVGARAALGRLLVFHDSDMLVPQAYASELWARCQEGYELINLKRFVFYLTEGHSGAVCTGDRRLAALPAEAIVQNLEAGGSVAMAREAFLAIGGYDESFVGWGGEDNEFWQRALTRKSWPYGYMPIVHLWHASQPGKETRDPHVTTQLQELSAVAPADRIATLTRRNLGDARRMDPPWQRENP